MKFDFPKKIFMSILIGVCIIPLLTGCMTHFLWDQGTVSRISDRKITTTEKTVHFQAKEKMKYPFPPFYWTSEQNHDRVFTAKSGVMSEWVIETDSNAPRFSRKFGLPMYRLPEKSILLRPGDQEPDGSYHVRQTLLKMHPDDVSFLEKPFLFCGYSVDGKLITTLQIPVSFQSGKLKCCLPEGSEIAVREDYVWEQSGLPRIWTYFWTPLTVICDIVLCPVYFVL